MAKTIFKAQEKWAFGFRLRRLVDERNMNAIKNHCSLVTQNVLAKAGGIEDRTTAGKWLKGKTMPPEKEKRESLCQFFGKNPDYFEDNYEKLWKELSTDSILLQRFIEEEIEPKVEKYGIDTRFLMMLHNLYDMDDAYIPWVPIRKKTERTLSDPCFFEMANYTIQPKVSQYWLQVHKSVDGRDTYITLSPDDIVFLKEMQENVKRYISSEFARREKILQDRLEEANCEAYQKDEHEDGQFETNSRILDRIVAEYNSNDEALQKINRYIENNEARLLIKQSQKPKTFESPGEFHKAWNATNSDQID